MISRHREELGSGRRAIGLAMEAAGRRFSMLNARRRKIAAMTEGWWRHRAGEGEPTGADAKRLRAPPSA